MRYRGTHELLRGTLEKIFQKVASLTLTISVISLYYIRFSRPETILALLQGENSNPESVYGVPAGLEVITVSCL